MISYAGVFQSEIIRSFGKENTVARHEGVQSLTKKLLLLDLNQKSVCGQTECRQVAKRIKFMPFSILFKPKCVDVFYHNNNIALQLH